MLHQKSGPPSVPRTNGGTVSEIVEHEEWMEPEEDWAEQRQLASGNVRIVVEGPAPDKYTLEMLASLLLGSATEGGEQLAVRLKRWQATTDGRGNEIYSEPLNETDQERLRYAIIGLLAGAPGAAQRTFNTAVNVSDTAYSFVTRLLSPVANSRVGRPLQKRYDRYAAHGASLVEQWIDTGRVAEQRGRALARQAAFDGEDEVMNQVIGVLGTKPEVRELITQQSIGMAQQLMLELRHRTFISDGKWERHIHRLLRRG